MRQGFGIVLVILLISIAAGPILGLEEECAAEKKAKDAAEQNLKVVTEAWLAAVDKVMEAYGELGDATSWAKDLAGQLRVAYNDSVAAWVAFNLCREKNSRSMCEKEYKAAKDAESRYNQLMKESADADILVASAMSVLEAAKAVAREMNEKRKAAQQAYDDAVVAYDRCMRRAS